MEDKVELTDRFLDEMLNLKSCLLEVQLRFFEMRSIHQDHFLTELESMILQLVQRVEHLENQIKNALQSYRAKLQNTNERINMPNYENLLNAKRFHLRKLIEDVAYETPDNFKECKVLLLKFKQKKLYELQLQ